jgi:hypothetical protein
MLVPLRLGCGRNSTATRSRLGDLIAEDAGADEESAGGEGTFFTELKADPGACWGWTACWRR